MAYLPGWQLVSIPLKPGPKQVLPSMFAFSDGYIPATSMVFGKGYWAKPPDTVSYWGGRVLTDSIMVKRGWNLVGSLSCAISVGTFLSRIDNIIESPFYGYTRNGYFIADSLKPGKGYWVKARGDGILIQRATGN